MPVRNLFAEFSKRMITFDGYSLSYAMCGDKSSGVQTLQNNNNNKKSRERERELEREGKMENERRRTCLGRVKWVR